MPYFPHLSKEFVSPSCSDSSRCYPLLSLSYSKYGSAHQCFHSSHSSLFRRRAIQYSFSHQTPPNHITGVTDRSGQPFSNQTGSEILRGRHSASSIQKLSRSSFKEKRWRTMHSSNYPCLQTSQTSGNSDIDKGLHSHITVTQTREIFFPKAAPLSKFLSSRHEQ